MIQIKRRKQQEAAENWSWLEKKTKKILLMRKIICWENQFFVFWYMPIMYFSFDRERANNIDLLWSYIIGDDFSLLFLSLSPIFFQNKYNKYHSINDSCLQWSRPPTTIMNVGDNRWTKKKNTYQFYSKGESVEEREKKANICFFSRA